MFTQGLFTCLEFFFFAVKTMLSAIKRNLFYLLGKSVIWWRKRNWMFCNLMAEFLYLFHSFGNSAGSNSSSCEEKKSQEVLVRILSHLNHWFLVQQFLLSCLSTKLYHPTPCQSCTVYMELTMWLESSTKVLRVVKAKP